MELVKALLVWVLPPLLGAIIGYVTNAIAIRMLFRPLTEKRLLGIRIPLTPGLIPRERGDLAESMARMVATELLTEEAVRRQIHAPSFQESVRTSISSITSELLSTPLHRVGRGLIPGVPDSGPREEPAGPLGAVGGLLSSLLSGFTRSESFSALLRDLVRHMVREFSQRPVGSVLGQGRSLDGMVQAMVANLNSEHGRSELRSRVSGWIDRQFSENMPLERLLTEEDADSIAQLVDSVYPSLIQFFMRWLRSEGARRELIIRGRFLVQDIVDRLNGIQRFIITAAQYQRTLDENMEGIIDDALVSIEEAGTDPDSRKKLVEAIKKELRSIRRKGLADVAARHRERIEQAAGSLTDRAVGFLSGAEFSGGIVGLLVGDGEGEQTVGELLDRLFGLSGGDPGDFLADLILPRRAPDEGGEQADRPPGDGGMFAGAVTGFFQGFFERHGQMPLGEFLGLSETAKGDFDRALTETLITTVDARIPQILESIDIHDLVVSKINGLDIEEVEKLLLRVIEKHLRWINIFGALLGALIGLIQDLLRLFQLSG